MAKKLLLILLCSFILTACATQANSKHKRWITFKSDKPVDETVTTIAYQLQKGGFVIPLVVRHENSAKKLGVDIKPHHLIVFGNPIFGTPLIQTNPEVAAELPLKLLVFENAEGETVIKVQSPSYLMEEYNLQANEAAILKMEEGLKNLFQGSKKITTTHDIKKIDAEDNKTEATTEKTEKNQ